MTETVMQKIGTPVDSEEIKEAMKRLIVADRMKTEAKAILEEYSAAVKGLAALVNVGYAFQDDEGVVYEVAETDGKFVYFEPIVVNRTRRAGEAKGSLSVKRAQELGFEPVIVKGGQE